MGNPLSTNVHKVSTPDHVFASGFALQKSVNGPMPLILRATVCVASAIAKRVMQNKVKDAHVHADAKLDVTAPAVAQNASLVAAGTSWCRSKCRRCVTKVPTAALANLHGLYGTFRPNGTCVLFLLFWWMPSPFRNLWLGQCPCSFVPRCVRLVPWHVVEHG
jgi:hypothetical protein